MLRKGKRTIGFDELELALDLLIFFFLYMSPSLNVLSNFNLFL